LRERKRIASELQSYQIALQDKIELLNASNLGLEQFAYVASHDLQEPLRKIIAFSDRITTRYKNAIDGDAQNYIERIANAAIRMRKLIDDLLNYSKMARASMQMKDVDLNKVLKTVIDDLEVPIRNENALVDIGILPVIKGEEVQLLQLFQNLLSNALKFTTPGVSPHVEINATMISGNQLSSNRAIFSRQNYCRITVKDNGIGFEEKYADKIFVIFQRLHGRNEYEGTGIGLAICKKIAENHSGFISANSYPGKGTTFNVILPAG
jgi:light-regulated signal transduction histidine kinase (bacteriophytochrome)